jgi:hypothetical protein
MKKVKKVIEKCDIKGSCGNSNSTLYFLGFVGAAIYYLSTATSFWMGFLGLLKSFVWPLFLVYEILSFLGA